MSYSAALSMRPETGKDGRNLPPESSVCVERTITKLSTMTGQR